MRHRHATVPLRHKKHDHFRLSACNYLLLALLCALPPPTIALTLSNYGVLSEKKKKSTRPPWMKPGEGAAAQRLLMKSVAVVFSFVDGRMFASRQPHPMRGTERSYGVVLRYDKNKGITRWSGGLGRV